MKERRKWWTVKVIDDKGKQIGWPYTSYDTLTAATAFAESAKVKVIEEGFECGVVEVQE